MEAHQEEKIRQQCEAREDYRLRQLDVQYQIDTLNKQLEQHSITFIGQIRMFLGESYPPEKSAAMLMANPTVVNAVYAKIQVSPEWMVHLSWRTSKAAERSSIGRFHIRPA